MKYCIHCGNEVHDKAVVCVNCGCALPNPSTGTVNPGVAAAIKIFMIIGCIGMSWTCWINVFGLGFGTVPCLLALLLPLAWCIPMTVSVFRSLNQGRTIGVAMKICVLLFVNTIAGICLLCLNDKN